MNINDITPNNNLPIYLEPYNISNECLYPGWTRVAVSDLPAAHAAKMLATAIDSKRYHNEYTNGNGDIISEGVDACIGPKDFSHELLEDSSIGPIGYETWLILQQLLKINSSLTVHAIRTVQSQPAYYNNLVKPCFRSYFQIPFVDFAGPIEAIGIYQQMESDPRLSNCWFDMFHTIDETGEVTIRFFIGRPFVDMEGNPNSSFSDDDFWELICDIAKELGSQPVT